MSLLQSGSFIAGDNYIKWDIKIDTTIPVVFTFANADLNTPECVSKNKPKDNYKPWGFDFIKKMGVSVVSISNIGHASWYRHPDLINALKTITNFLDVNHLDIRFGYGDSMGGFGVSAFSNMLKLKKCLLLYPISSLNTTLVPFVKGYQYGRSLNWDTPYNDGSKSNCTGVIVYDPLCRGDRLHAERYGAKYLKVRVPGLGHGCIGKLSNIGLIKRVLNDFLCDKELLAHEYRKLAKKTRHSNGYYEGMLSHKRMTFLKKQILTINHNYEYDYKVVEHKIVSLVLQKKIEDAFFLSKVYDYPNNHADIYRDFAIALECIDINLSHSLMKAALKIRPNGPFIKKKILEYRKIVD